MKDTNLDMSTGGVKSDTGKIQMDLLPPDALMAVAAGFTYGEIKYDAWNWAKGMGNGRLMAGIKRHAAAYELGEYFDEESGLPHLWLMGCGIMMLIALDLRGDLIEERAIDVPALENLRRRYAMMKPPEKVKAPQ